VDHTNILNAYLSRLTTADLENILKHENRRLQEMLNGNRNSQAQAQAGFYAAVANAVNNLSKHDLELIEGVIERVTA
jgi:hypothetical protein